MITAILVWLATLALAFFLGTTWPRERKKEEWERSREGMVQVLFVSAASDLYKKLSGGNIRVVSTTADLDKDLRVLWIPTK